MRRALASEVSVLAHMLNEISNQDRRARDFTLGVCAKRFARRLHVFLFTGLTSTSAPTSAKVIASIYNRQSRVPSRRMEPWRRRFSTSCRAFCCLRTWGVMEMFTATAGSCTLR